MVKEKRYKIMRFVVICLFALLSMSAIVLIKNPLVKTNWEVHHSVNEKGVKEFYKNSSYYINFQEKYFSLFVDENECNAQYQVEPKNGFSVFVGGGCTKICCDKPKSEWLKKRVFEVRKYYVSKDTLKLKGDNFEIVAIKKQKK